MICILYSGVTIEIAASPTRSTFDVDVDGRGGEGRGGSFPMSLVSIVGGNGSRGNISEMGIVQIYAVCCKTLMVFMVRELYGYSLSHDRMSHELGHH